MFTKAACASLVLASLVNAACSAGYGPLSLTKDMTTGLELLALPEGFSYMTYGWTGQYMNDGQPTPTDHDGMAVVDSIGSIISIVRNHETSLGEGPQLFHEGSYNPRQYGGTTNLYFDVSKGEWVGSESSLAGTIRPCAGGATPWGSWIAAEETRTYDDEVEISHGYLFDVLGFGGSDGKPILSAGRMSHEAVAVDPSTGVVYETEDARPAGFYKYVMPGAGGSDWDEMVHKGFTLKDGGELYALKVVDMPSMNMYGWNECEECPIIPNGETFDIEWVKIDNPSPEGPLDSTGAGPDAANPAILYQAEGAAHFTRGEGAWYHQGLVYFVSTDGGAVKEGQIWALNPGRNTLTMMWESPDSEVVDAPDNMAVSPTGGIIMCEDGGSNPKRLVGLSQEGETFTFAENRVVLGMSDMDVLEKHFPGTRENFHDIRLGSFTGAEWAGATFYGDWLFVNIQSPGITFAITGPWENSIF